MSRAHVIATAGHVDHGKSALVRALTGIEPDRLAEERRRGMTLDLGFAWTRLDDGSDVAFVDVPGHERFVPTMLAGVGPVPAALLVVAADEGWMPQSQEHLDALAAFGVRHGVLVVTRADLADPAAALAAAQERLAASAVGALPSVAVSSVTGAGLPALRAALAGLGAALPAPEPDADLRLWVDRAFSVRGAGTVVTGTLGGGTLRPGDELLLVGRHGERPVTVRGVQSQEQVVGEVTGVRRVALNLRGVTVAEIERGTALVAPRRWRDVEVLDVRLHAAAADVPGEAMLHIGSAAVAARVRPLGPDTARLRLQRALPLRIGDRVVLRDPGRRLIVAGATALDVAPPLLRRRGAAARRATVLASVTGSPDVADELARRGVVREAALAAMGVAPAEVARVDAVRAGGWLLDPARVPRLVAAVRAAVADHAAAAPLEAGIAVEAVRRAVGLPDRRLVEVLVRAAPGLTTVSGRVTTEGGPRVPAGLQGPLDALRADLRRRPFAAPDADRLAQLGLGPAEVAALVRAGALMRVADGVVLLPGADAAAVERLRGLGPTFTVSAARRAWDTSRRVAVPLLELLARAGHTARTVDGEHRIVDRSAARTAHRDR